LDPFIEKCHAISLEDPDTDHKRTLKGLENEIIFHLAFILVETWHFVPEQRKQDFPVGSEGYLGATSVEYTAAV
jgi:hypothetical protein